MIGYVERHRGEALADHWSVEAVEEGLRALGALKSAVDRGGQLRPGCCGYGTKSKRMTMAPKTE
jgi:hypothetical protein